MIEEKYYTRLAAAYVRGRRIRKTGRRESRGAPPLAALSNNHCLRIIRRGLDQGLRIHAFKRTMGLRRVNRVLGLLRGLNPSGLLDIGSGRGAFLWPLLDGFPQLPVTVIDMDERMVERIDAVRLGGVENLSVFKMNAEALQFDDNAFDAVAMLEVLEHTLDYEAAVREAVRVARRFVALTVPSKDDDNPGHIHLFNGDRLKELFLNCGAAKVQVEYVLNHIVVLASCAM